MTRGGHHVSTGNGGLEGYIGGAVVAASAEGDTVVGTLFRRAAAEAKYGLARKACISVGIEGTAHAAADLAFNDDNATRNREFAVAVDTVGVTGAGLCVVNAARNGQESAAATHAAAHAASGAESPVGLAALTGVARAVVAAGRIPGVIGSVDIGDAAVCLDVPSFEAFVGIGHVDGSVVNRKCGVGVDTVVLGRCNGGVAAVEVDVHVGVDAVIARRNVDLTSVNVDPVFRDDPLAGGGHVDGRGRDRVADNNIVVCLDTVIACLGDGDFATLDIDDALAIGDSGVGAVHGAFVTLDAVAACSRDGNVATFDIHKALTLGRIVADTQVVAGMDAVVVVAGHLECTFTLDGEVILGVDGSSRGILGAVCLGVVGRSSGGIGERVGGAAFEVNDDLVCVADIEGCVVRVGKR